VIIDHHHTNPCGGVQAIDGRLRRDVAHTNEHPGAAMLGKWGQCPISIGLVAIRGARRLRVAIAGQLRLAFDLFYVLSLLTAARDPARTAGPSAR
jgi:hypothetical protein